MAGLTVSMQELIEHQREDEWRKAGVSEADIRFSALSGMDARDVRAFREYSRRGLLLVVRCPKLAARVWHGVFPPKNMNIKTKTGSSGTVDHNQKVFVSDYDLMSIWRRGAQGWEKVFVSAANGARQGPWSVEARDLVLHLNHTLISKIQHGCQDDYQSPNNPGLKAGDHFAAFYGGMAEHFSNTMSCETFYARQGLRWPYDSSGRYLNG